MATCSIRDRLTDFDRRQYGHDRSGNRLYVDNIVEPTRSELYAYDGLNQLTAMDRGTLNGGKTAVSSTLRSQDWDYDGLGNFDSVTTNGGSAVTRTHNRQNEITGIAGATTPTYYDNGNLGIDESNRKFTYDAWNRLVIVQDVPGMFGIRPVLAGYKYDAAGRRVREIRGSTTELFYSDQWQVLEERVGSDVEVSYAWSPVYVDAMIARDRDDAGDLDERIYSLHDANFNVVALVDNSGTVLRRVAYDAYGSHDLLTSGWNTGASNSDAWTHYHQGGRWDAATEGYNFRNREYSPTLGRWLQMDPIGFEGNDVNCFRLTHNSPSMFSDPSGLAVHIDSISVTDQNEGRETKLINKWAE